VRIFYPRPRDEINRGGAPVNNGRHWSFVALLHDIWQGADRCQGQFLDFVKICIV
jgi:hypothetical protein